VNDRIEADAAARLAAIAKASADCTDHETEYADWLEPFRPISDTKGRLEEVTAQVTELKAQLEAELERRRWNGPVSRHSRPRRSQATAQGPPPSPQPLNRRSAQPCTSACGGWPC
jgi:hypothetical protein